MFLTEDGRVYGCGLSTDGQLGPQDTYSQTSGSVSSRLLDQLVLEPARLTCLGEFKIIQLAAGKSHTIALTEAGEPLAFGSNEFGQLGRRADREEDESIPVRVSGLGGTRIIQVGRGLRAVLGPSCSRAISSRVRVLSRCRCAQARSTPFCSQTSGKC